MSSRAPVSLTRRQFVIGAAGAAAITTAATSGLSMPATAATTSKRGYESGPPYGEAAISEEGYRTLAEHERAQQKKGNSISYDKRLNAVEDLGCDPTGQEPIDQKVTQAAGDGVLIVFPPGEYLIRGGITTSVGGTFGIVGEGFSKSKQPPKPGKGSVVFHAGSGGPIDMFNLADVSAGQFGNFVIDGRDPHPHAGMTVHSTGNVRVKDVRNMGVRTTIDQSDGLPSFFTPFADAPDAVIIMERCIARGGGIPGTKNIGGTHGFSVFGRSGDQGTIILKDGVIENMADNGIYGSRTTATLHVLGGLYRNNDVSQVRVNGDATVDGVDVVVDEQHYTGVKSKSYGQERGPGWPSTNGIKIESKQSISATTGTKVTNCNIQARSLAPDVGEMGALIRIWDDGGAVTIDNCKITNNVGKTTSIFAEEPGSGHYPPAPKPWTITVKNSVIQGSGASQGTPIDIRGRPRSIVTSTCLQYSGASPSDIEGAQTSGVGFGGQCKSAGLRAASKVGSSGNLSSMNLSAMNVSSSNMSAGVIPSRRRQKAKKAQKAGIIKAMATTVFMIIAALVGVGITILALAALIGAGLMLLSYFVIDG